MDNADDDLFSDPALLPSVLMRARDDTRVQLVAWLAATAGVLKPGEALWDWPGLLDFLVPQVTRQSQVVFGWGLATILLMGAAAGRLHLVFTVERRAMTFPLRSFLVFARLRHPCVGSIVYFDGYDGKSYVSRVQAVQRRPYSKAVSCIQTHGDLPGAPSDQPLYSPDGSAAWLDLQAVRGTLVAGPFSVPFLTVLGCVAGILIPSGVRAFFITSQALFVALLYMVIRIVVLMFAFS
eukprot:CAMPEP_0172866380 /NCGR_PEP_ID=MMETSP1075-20121228/81952_1 /TAXON_ID=2916 /ORGANISM="Ceratium fusus, Strain PA161109" /LENGTH=236 /DNA_ID=CAMNT_0013715541 /DNA_START=97 /DNA_END=804 /DNA_ORIENTATION=-